MDSISATVTDRDNALVSPAPQIDLAPGSDGARVKLNLGCGPAQIIGDHINVDIVDFTGVDVVQDLFAFPWSELEKYENTVDEIFCSHLVEHIPHDVVKASDYPLAAWDGFYCFFYECWKLLKTSGRMEVIVPHARSNGAFQDPTHRRFLVETSFSYLNPMSGYIPPELPFGFNQSDLLLTTSSNVADMANLNGPGADDAMKAKWLASLEWNAIVEFKVELFPVK